MSVTLWWASPAHVRPWHDDLLTAPERERATAYRRRADRDRFVVCNALMRLALARHLGSPADIDRTCTSCGKPHGKPAVVGHALEISASHSGDWIAVALSARAPIGVDVEEIKPGKDMGQLLNYVFSPSELTLLPDPKAVFYQAWTRKEAILKATGEGLRKPMSGLTVLPECSHNVRDLHPGPGYAAAVAMLDPEPFTVTELDGSELLR